MTDLERFAAYLGPQSEEYAERIQTKARIHTMPLRVEALAAIMAGLGCLHAALEIDGDTGSFRETVNECVSEILDAATRMDSAVSPRSTGDLTS